MLYLSVDECRRSMSGRRVPCRAAITAVLLNDELKCSGCNRGKVRARGRVAVRSRYIWTIEC
jgi:hypothetical protein